MSVFCEDSGTALMPLKFRRGGCVHNPFLYVLISPLSYRVYLNNYNTYREPIRSVCNRRSKSAILSALEPKIQENMTVHGMCRLADGRIYTVLPNT